MHRLHNAVKASRVFRVKSLMSLADARVKNFPRDNSDIFINNPSIIIIPRESVTTNKAYMLKVCSLSHLKAFSCLTRPTSPRNISCGIFHWCISGNKDCFGSVKYRLTKDKRITHFPSAMCPIYVEIGQLQMMPWVHAFTVFIKFSKCSYKDRGLSQSSIVGSWYG